MPYFQFLRENMRWLLGGLLLTLFSSFGQTFFIAMSTGYIREDFALTSGEYGSIYMIATLASAMTLPFVGRVVDHYSIVKVATVTMIMLAVSCIAMGKTQSIILLILALYGLRLFGQGMMGHIALTAMGRWYAANRGKAVSIVSLGFNAGAALLPVSFVGVIALIGWRDAWVVAAVIVIVVALPSIFALMRVERTPLGKKSDEVADEVGRQWTSSEMLRDPIFWLTCIGVLAPPFISTAIFFHQDFVVTEKGWTLGLFAQSLVIMTVVSIFATLAAGIAIDKKSAVFLLPTFLVPLGIGCMILANFGSPFALVIYMMVLGVGFGITSTIIGALWPEVYGSRNLGSIRSIVMALMVLFSALGPGAMGWAIDFDVPLKVQLYWMGGYCFVASVALYFCSVRYKQRLLAFTTA